MIIIPGITAKGAEVYELPQPPDFDIEHLAEIQKASDALYDLIDDELEEIQDNKSERTMYKRAMTEKLYQTRAALIDLDDFIKFCTEIIQAEEAEEANE